MRAKDERSLWAELVGLTSRGEHQALEPLRIALFNLLLSPRNSSIPRQVFHLTKRCVKPNLTGKRLAKVERGKTLICFPHRTPSNISNLLPVARELDRRGQLGAIVTAADYTAELSELAASAPVVVAADLLKAISLTSQARAMAAAYDLTGKCLTLLEEYDPALAGKLRRNWGSMFCCCLDSVGYGEAWKRALDEWRPSRVVSTSDLWPFECQLARQARQAGIPSLVLQHGIVSYSYWPFAADRWVMWGRRSLDEMRALGAPSERLQLGGMPSSDKLFQAGLPTRTPTLGSVERRVCLVLSHTRSRYLEADVYSAYRSFMNDLIHMVDGIELRIKLHPAEDASFWMDLVNRSEGKLTVLPRQIGLAEALAEADVATTLYSTAGLEAMAAGVPLIVPIVHARMKDPKCLPQLEGSLRVEGVREFLAAVDRCTFDTEARERQVAFQHESLDDCFSNQGQASSAIAALLAESL